MSGTVPSLSIVFMIISCVIGFAIPVVLLLYFRLRKKADYLPFFIGCAVMILFAFVLESLVHRMVLSSSAGATIRENIWTYALYGGAMAGLFEETGRFLACKTILRKYRNRDINALMYGAGHGGIEAAVLLGITMINNLIYSFLINADKLYLLTEPLPEEYKAQFAEVIEALITTPSYQFLLGGVERVFAVIVQISFSVLVWFAAKNKEKFLYYPLAILLHLLVDGSLVIAMDHGMGEGVNTIFLEGMVGVLALLCALLARSVWKRNAGRKKISKLNGVWEHVGTLF